MPIVNVDLSDSREPQPLDNGRYTVRVAAVENKVKDGGKMSLMVRMEVIAGQTQKDGSDAEGRVLFDFFSLNGYETMKDGGDFVKRKLKGFLDAADASEDDEAEDLVDREFDVVTRIKRDTDGISQNEIRHYRKIGE